MISPLISSPSAAPTFNIPMLKMKRTELLLCLLLISTICAACQHDYNFIPMAQAIKAGKLQLFTGNETLINECDAVFSSIPDMVVEAIKSNKSSVFYNLRSTGGHILANLGKYEKIHKPPSGPNPNGNHRPPSRAKPNGKSSSIIRP
ncbi:hypothetical protein RND71_021087 [Anisodus tanguticus]|uniref:Uncharacterized protein n=1 Tax=Anisodus tanguticus TaxID=243964 RepID=A0AAE1RVX2_9SOLA|nr:hypothetical protein RND71_021087 [Anisodus tanguticus]